MTQLDPYREAVNPYAPLLDQARVALAAKEAADRAVVDRWNAALEDLRALVEPTLRVDVEYSYGHTRHARLIAPLTGTGHLLAQEFCTDELEAHIKTWAFARAVRDLGDAERRKAAQERALDDHWRAEKRLDDARRRAYEGPCGYDGDDALACSESAPAQPIAPPEAWVVPARLLDPSTPVPWSVWLLLLAVALSLGAVTGLFLGAGPGLAAAFAGAACATGGVAETRRHIRQHSARHEPRDRSEGT